MSQWSRRYSRERHRSRSRGVRAEAERRAGVIAAVAAVGIAVAVGVTILIWTLTRPPQIPEPRWPAMSLSVRRETNTPVTQQVWWRKSTWCSRLPGEGDDVLWATSYRRAYIALSALNDKSALEINEGGGAGPFDGFGERSTQEARSLWQAGTAKILRTEKVAGRDALVVRAATATQQSPSVRTWWIDTDRGITLRYKETSGKDTLSEWRVTKISTRAGPPWTKDEAASLDRLLATEFGIVSVSDASNPAGGQVAQPEQYPVYHSLAERVFSVCRAGSSTTIPKPTPSPAPTPGPPGASPAEPVLEPAPPPSP